jgi:hypothetical protein
MRIVLFILLALFILFAAGTIVFFPKLQRVYWAMHLFDAAKIEGNFMGMYQKFGAKEIKAAEHPYRFPQGQTITLPNEFSFEGTRYNSSEYLKEAFTNGFMVVQNGNVVYEEYFSGNSESTQYISWSMAKSVVSALFGIAMEEGLIKDINQTIEEYLPELIGSGYEGVRIKDVLQMSAGVKFNEDYGDFKSDINKWGRKFALGSSQD